MRELVIVGAGDHARETLDIVDAINSRVPSWSFAGFVDDQPFREVKGRLPRGEHLGPISALETMDHYYVLGIGNPATRAALDARLTSWNRRAVTLVHPLASLGGDNEVGDGVLLAAGARVTTNITLGRHVHLNVNAVINHDGTIGAHTTISPGVHLAGRVTVGDRCYLGIGAIVKDGVTIGDDVTVGAGAVVVEDVPSGVIAKGVPARWGDQH